MASSRYLAAVLAAEKDDSKSNLVKPNDLDIYWEPQSSAPVTLTPKNSALLQQVSKARQFLWRFSGNASDLYKKVSNTKDVIENAYETAVKDPITLIRPGCIATAIFVGALLPGRGRRPFMRLLSVSALGTTAAAVSYPHRASEISISAFYKGKDFGATVLQSIRKKLEESKKVVDTESSADSKDEVDISSKIAQPEEELTTVVESEENVFSIQDATENNLNPDTQAISADNLEVSEVKETFIMTDVTEQEDAVLDEVEIHPEDPMEENSNETLKEEDIILKEQGDYGQSVPEDKDMYSRRQ